jgi:hypothetical protein
VDAAVDVSLALNKSFAVVPCCVYFKEFGGRRTPDGKQVRTYEQLCEYAP